MSSFLCTIILLMSFINEQCGTDVQSPIHFNGLPDFLSDNNCAICPTGNRTTFVTKRPSRLVEKCIFLIEAHVAVCWRMGLAGDLVWT